MPGLLWPKIEDPEVARKLAVTGAISDNILPQEELALWLLQWLRQVLPGRIEARYMVAEEGTEAELLSAIARSRGFLLAGAEPDLAKGAIMLLDEFRAGKLGAVTLDRDFPAEDTGC